MVEEYSPQISDMSDKMRHGLEKELSVARLYADIDTINVKRYTSGFDEFDRVLGGGIVPGSVVLLGGEPGIGKSTLVLQVAGLVAREIGPVLYASGEESEHQVKMRGERLGVGASPLHILAETCLERILDEVLRLKPALLIVDSIQTVFSMKFQSAPGSIGQVREAATQLLFTAKSQNLPTFLVGHVTKDGHLAGPKVLEHVVDTVLYFEGERHHSNRLVRAVKNRFGAVSESVAEQMAIGIRKRTGADIGLSTTGVAGPEGGSPEKPVGLIFIGVSGPQGNQTQRLQFPGPRDTVRIRTARFALDLVRRSLL